MKERAIVFFSFFVLFCFFSSFKTAVQIPDEEFVIRVAQNIAEGKPLHLPNHSPYSSSSLAERGADGNLYSTYPIGQSLIVAPYYRASKAFFTLVSSPDPNEIERRVTRSLYVLPALFSSLTCLLIFMFCRLFESSKRKTLWVAGLTGVGTIVWPYSKYLLTESTQTVLLLATVYLLCKQSRDRLYRAYPMALAGIAFGLLNSIKPTFLILAPLFAIFVFYRNSKWKKAVRPSLVFIFLFLIAFSPQLAYNSVRFSGIQNFGYSGSSFSSPLYAGLYGLLLSAGKGFFFYSPVTALFFFAIAPFWKKYRREAALFFAIIAVMVLVYARWDIWSGDYCWGPRFLVPLVPFFMIPIVLLPDRKFFRMDNWRVWPLAALIAVAVFVQLLAISAHYLIYLNYFKYNVSFIAPMNRSVEFKGTYGKLGLRDHNVDFQFVPEFSPLVGQWWVVRNLISKDAFRETPWKGLGLNRFHEKIPLKANFDFWFAEPTRGEP